MPAVYEVETLVNQQAFEMYYSMGESRTLEQISKEYKRTPRTIAEWSRKFNWRERVEQRDITIGQKMAKKNIKLIIDEKANYRKLIKLCLSKFIVNLKDDKVQMRSILDLEKLIKLDLLLMGEASEITQSQTEVGLTSEDRESMMAYADAMKLNLKEHYNPLQK